MLHPIHILIYENITYIQFDVILIVENISDDYCREDVPLKSFDTLEEAEIFSQSIASLLELAIVYWNQI